MAKGPMTMTVPVNPRWYKCADESIVNLDLLARVEVKGLIGAEEWCVYGYVRGLPGILIEEGFDSEGRAWVWVHEALGISWFSSRRKINASAEEAG